MPSRYWKNEEYGEQSLFPEYYEHKGDYERAYRVRSEESEGFAAMCLTGVRSSLHHEFRLMLEEKREEARRELEYIRQRDYLLFGIIGLFVICVGIIIWWFYDRKCLENSQLLMRIGVLIGQVSERGPSPQLGPIIKNLGSIYSDYYEIEKSADTADKEADLLSRLRSGIEGIETLTEDEKFLECLESEININTRNLLNDVYGSLHRKLNDSQRRIVVYCSLGLPAKCICAILNVKREVFYNKKSRLSKAIMKSTSKWKQELLDILVGE